MPDRELKFRAWDGKQMRYNITPWQWDFVIARNYWYCERSHTEDTPARMHVDAYPFTHVMQYVGLKDKNGKEIYEGDVVDARSAGSHCRGVIVWGVAGFFIQIPPPQSIWYLTGPNDPCEVIGNVWENPKLRKVVR